MARFLIWVEYLKIFSILGKILGIIIKILCEGGLNDSNLNYPKIGRIKTMPEHFQN
jgi:hypothetical protein